MPPAASQPPRPPENMRENTRRPAGPEPPAAGNGQSVYQHTTDELIAGSLSLNMADFFAEALDSAIALVRADGGELATLDSARQALTLRARAKKPRLGGLGAPGRSSQPLHPALRGASSPSASASGIAHDLNASSPSVSGARELPEEFGIDSQSTMLLPAALSARLYRRGEGLIGQVWLRGEPVMMTGEEFRAQPQNAGSSGADAPWHLAVPMFRPVALGVVPSESDVIGVLSVYIRDPRWSFSKAHVELLTLQADRIARSMRMAELARQNESRGELLEVLRSVDGAPTDLRTLFPHVRDIVRHLVDAPSFAVVLLERAPAHQRQPSMQDPKVYFELAEYEGHAVSAEARPSAQMPAWWRALWNERVICVSTAEERAARPELMRLGFGGDQPVQSVLAAPLIGSGSPLGAIVAGSPNPDAYAPEHIGLIETVAHAAAIVIENALMARDRERSLRLVEERATNLAVLNNAVLTLNASLDLETTLRAVSDQAKSLTRAGVLCVVFLSDPMERELVWRAPHTEDAPPAGPREVRIPLDWHNIAKAMESQQFLVLDQLESEWNDGTSMGGWLARNEIHSCVVLPMERPDHAQDQPSALDQRTPRSPHLGVLLVSIAGAQQPFSATETGLLQGLASQAAVAISNAKLYEDLKTLDRLKDDFILTVSHEFRTPLTTINGYMSLISRHADRLDTQRLEQYGQEIRVATEQLTGMINMLVDVNRMDSEPLRVEPVPVSAHEAAAHAITNLPEESKQRILNEVPEGLWISADAERLPTVFSNFVSNALKYGSETTQCRITARIESAETLARQGRKIVATGSGAARQWAVLGVRDFGIGIAESDQHRLFHKFVRLPQTLTTKVRGTGLGLWICKQYITAMGGDIWIESTYGHGAHFQFCLPVAPPPSEQ